MKEFIFIAHNKTVSQYIELEKLESAIVHSDTFYHKIVNTDSILYDNIICYQVFKTANITKNYSNNIVISGDIYGVLDNNNTKLLDYNEAIDLIQKNNFIYNYDHYEGNACILTFTKDKIVFQNDIEGYRKLFYYQNENILCVSTNLIYIIKAIKKQWKLRKNAVLAYLCSRESKWPLTFIEDIFSLPPLSRGEISNKGLFITSKTFSDFYNLKPTSKKELREQLYAQYELIIKRKFGNNVAVTLSGGYDSNCLTKLYSKVYKDNFTTVSIGYNAVKECDNNIYNETIYAEKIAHKLRIPFKKYIFNQSDFINELPNFIAAIDQPGHDPSSNYIMNKYLKQDGFDLVVNGMGGDANFASKRNLRFALKIYNISKKIGCNFIQTIGRKLDYRGPFTYFYPYINSNEHTIFHDYYERAQIFGSNACEYLSTLKKIEIDKERENRIDYYHNLYSKAKTLQEVFYSLAITSSPGEYHAFLTADRNNIEILMPFINTKSVLIVMNGSQLDINNRKFETSIFGGIDENLLAKRKSGLSIPYSEWVKVFANEIFQFYMDLKYFSKEDFNIHLFMEKYKSDEVFSNSHSANVVLWKLLVIKEYFQMNNLIL